MVLRHSFTLMLPPPKRVSRAPFLARFWKLHTRIYDACLYERRVPRRGATYAVGKGFSRGSLPRLPSGGLPVPASRAFGSLARGQPNWFIKPGMTRSGARDRRRAAGRQGWARTRGCRRGCRAGDGARVGADCTTTGPLRTTLPNVGGWVARAGKLTKVDPIVEPSPAQIDEVG